MAKEIKNMGAPVRARLLNVSKEGGQNHQLVLTRYAHERLLYRLSESEYAGRFVLKGAVLLMTWFDEPFRGTRDVALLGHGDPDPAAVLGVFRNILAREADDGVRFDAKGAKIGHIRGDTEYGGLRTKTTADVGGARVPIRLDFAYLAFDTTNAAAAVAALRSLGMRGGNFTMSLKQAVIPHPDALSTEAELAGAVNVIVSDGCRLTGHVTNGTGFLLSLREREIDIARKRLALLGAGGAAVAVSASAALAGATGCDSSTARISICPRQCGPLPGSPHVPAVQCVSKADLLINATPVGMEDSLDAMALPDARPLRPIWWSATRSTCRPRPGCYAKRLRGAASPCPAPACNFTRPPRPSGSGPVTT